MQFSEMPLFRTYSFELNFAEAVNFGPFPEIQVRRWLEWGLKNICCRDLDGDCSHCEYQQRCFHFRMFESDGLAPFVFHVQRKTLPFKEIQSLRIELTLFGTSLHNLPQLLAALDKAGDYGYVLSDKRKVPFWVQEVCQKQDVEWISIYHRYSGELSDLYSQPPQPFHPDSFPSCQKLQLRWQTPIILNKHKGIIDFPKILQLILQRHDLLCKNFGEQKSLTDWSALKEKSETIQCNPLALGQRQIRYYSFKQKRTLFFRGFDCQVTLHGSLGMFIPWLRLGEILQVGKQTGFGFGAYQIIIK